MEIIECNIQEPYYTFVLEGKKTIEGRLNKGSFASLKPGDRIRINDNHFFDVLAVRPYPTFRAMIAAEGVSSVIPDKTTVDEAAQVYYRFYTPEQEKKFGVLAIEIKKTV